jgi:hypothetical protein
VLRAIQRNPPAYFRRIPRLAYAAFINLVQNYHWHFAVFCFVFVARGILALLLGRSYFLLATLLVWPASSLLHILILFHGPHLLIPFVNVFALAAIGVTAAARNLDSPLERRWWVAALLALTALGVAAYQRPNDLLLAPLMLLITTPDVFWAWMARERIQAIYVDGALRILEPVAWQTIRSQIGHGLDVVFDKAPGAPTVDWHNAMFHSRPPQSGPVQVLVRAPGGSP